MEYDELWKVYEEQVRVLEGYDLEKVEFLKQEFDGPNRVIKYIKFSFKKTNIPFIIKLKCYYHITKERECLIKSNIVKTSIEIAEEKDNLNKLLFEFLDENFY